MEAARARPKDRSEVASDLGLPLDDPVVDAFMAGLKDEGGGLISRTLGSSRARAMFHLMRARQSEQWAALAAGVYPILLLLATRPEDAPNRQRGRGRAVRQPPSLAPTSGSSTRPTPSITDLRDAFGRRRPRTGSRTIEATPPAGRSGTHSSQGSDG